MKLPLHKTMSNQEISNVMDFISEVIGLNPDNRFRVKAYQEAAETIAQWDTPLVDIYADNPQEEAAKIFNSIPGIGDSITQKLIELFSTGDISSFQKYVKAIPAGVFSLCQVNGIGAKRAFKICTNFTVSDEHALEDVVALAKKGEIRKLEGFGEKSEADLIRFIEDYRAQERMPYQKARALADKIESEVKKDPHITKIEVLGSLRRHHVTIGDIDLGIATDDVQATQQFVEHIPLVKRVVVSGEGLMRVILKSGQQVDIKVSPENEWGSFLQHFTGSKEHNIMLRKYALKRGVSLSEHGITNRKTKEITTYDSEENFYHALGLEWIPPRERKGGTELERYKLV
jgi:DNA polymerase (family 10)